MWQMQPLGSIVTYQRCLKGLAELAAAGAATSSCRWQRGQTAVLDLAVAAVAGSCWRHHQTHLQGLTVSA